MKTNENFKHSLQRHFPLEQHLPDNLQSLVDRIPNLQNTENKNERIDVEKTVNCP